MNIFLKLSDPVYFKKFGIRLVFATGLFGLLLSGYILYISVQEHSQLRVFGMLLSISIYNILLAATKWYKLKKEQARFNKF